MLISLLTRLNGKCARNRHNLQMGIKTELGTNELTRRRKANLRLIQESHSGCAPRQRVDL